MRLTLIPDTVTFKSVISELFIEDVFQCYVLELSPPLVPAGLYQVLLQNSVKFGRIMPMIQNVPGHTGIEIHPGNTAVDTRGCLLVGKTKAADFVGESDDAFKELFAKISPLSAEPLSIEIKRQVIPLSVPRQVIPPIAKPVVERSSTVMNTLEAWFNSPRAHAVGTLAFGVAAQFFPQYAIILNTVAAAFGYGAVVAGAPAPASTPAK